MNLQRHAEFSCRQAKLNRKMDELASQGFHLVKLWEVKLRWATRPT